jgi:hypothetical protein
MLLARYSYCDQSKEVYVCMACSTHDRELYIELLQENEKESDHYEDTDLEGMVWDGENWTNLPGDRDGWGALVNTVMNLRAPLNAGNNTTS